MIELRTEAWAWRDGSVAMSLGDASRGPEIRLPHPQQAAYTHIQLHLQENRKPSFGLSLCIHINKSTRSHN